MKHEPSYDLTLLSFTVGTNGHGIRARDEDEGADFKPRNTRNTRKGRAGFEQEKTERTESRVNSKP